MTDTLFSVSDRVVLVSGGSRGIGLALANGFARRGAKVIITGRNSDTLQTAAAAISSSENPVHTIACDVSDSEQIDELVSQTVQEFGRIDVLVNVAGVNQRKRVESFTEAEYDFILDINLKGAFLLSQAVGRQMIEQGDGVQINIDSLNTYAPLKGVAPYAMSKAGLSMMTRSLALEWGPRGVRVNGLAPGFILTDLTNKLWSDEKIRAWGERNTPLGRLGEVDDLVGATIFLASDASRFMTGQTIYVDGGMSAGINWPIPEESLGG
ncbi:SDR family NAD(P)-dependent oxidoreductase [Thalassoroseus pseudoceratinae]|uniref:SDR family NAD(P)-dependent oxidoreductase n=1 Tax=Thalassoroseus pseudoceratinae TaxID=2713176 RepID=UPI001423312B|nr:glucose 1-dehydrogenase [Thalassoroseus pseudoceratinae]